jgi:predicted ATPase
VGELLIERLTGARVLLLLDNFEHVIAAAPFVSRLLSGCPLVKVIVTSRALLSLRGEHEFVVMPLELPPLGAAAAPNGGLGAAAVRLFVERAQDHLPSFAVQGTDARAVVELCWRLEGLPLAIELAAAHVRVLPPAALLARIGDRLDLLSGPSDLPERQRTLRATIDWSYNLLDQPERDLFAALSVFVGGFTLESAQAVCDSDIDVLQGVSSLIENSLVGAHERPELEPRFRMLETLREYAQERLERRGNARETRLRMAQYLAGVAEEAFYGLIGSEQRGWFSRLDAEVDNLRAALAWAFENDEPGLFLSIAWLPYVYWWERGYVAELRPLVERSLERFPSLEPASRAMQLRYVAHARIITGDSEASLPLLREVIELDRALGDEHGLALAQWSYAVNSQREPVAERRAMLSGAVATLRRLGDQRSASLAQSGLALYALRDGEAGEAERLAQESLELAQAIDSDSMIGVARVMLGSCALARAEVALARSTLADAAAACQRARNRDGLAYVLDGLAAVALAQGKPELAAKGIGAADATRERIGIGLYPRISRTFRAPSCPPSKPHSARPPSRPRGPTVAKPTPTKQSNSSSGSSHNPPTGAFGDIGGRL